MVHLALRTTSSRKQLKRALLNCSSGKLRLIFRLNNDVCKERLLMLAQHRLWVAAAAGLVVR